MGSHLSRPLGAAEMMQRPNAGVGWRSSEDTDLQAMGPGWQSQASLGA